MFHWEAADGFVLCKPGSATSPSVFLAPVLRSHWNWLDVQTLYTLHFSLYLSQEADGAKSGTNLRRRLTRWTPGALGDFGEAILDTPVRQMCWWISVFASPRHQRHSREAALCYLFIAPALAECDSFSIYIGLLRAMGHPSLDLWSAWAALWGVGWPAGLFLCKWATAFLSVVQVS